MTYFQLKLIALITMAIDHLGNALAFTSLASLLGGRLIPLMRGIGRISFTIFAFGIANGMIHTSNRKNYIKRLFLFAFISQIPFSLSSSVENYSLVFDPSSLLVETRGVAYLLFFFIVPICYLFWEDKKALVYMGLASLMAYIRIASLDGYVLNNPYYLNIFYTLAVGALIIQAGEKVRSREVSLVDKLCWIIIIYSSIGLFASVSDYGFLGVITIIFFYLAYKSRILRSLVALAFLLAQYIKTRSYFDYYFLPGLLACLFIYLYTGEKGKASLAFKRFFYIFYPAHFFIFYLLAKYILT